MNNGNGDDDSVLWVAVVFVQANGLVCNFWAYQNNHSEKFHSDAGTLLP